MIGTPAIAMATTAVLLAFGTRTRPGPDGNCTAARRLGVRRYGRRHPFRFGK